LAEKPNREFASRCKLVKSNSNGEKLRARFAFLPRDAGLAEAFVLDGLSLGEFPDPFGTQIRFALFSGKILVKPTSRILPRFRIKSAMDLPIGRETNF